MEHIERFWAKVDKSGGDDACWPWVGGRDGGGYGVFYASDGSGKPKHKAHRWLLGVLRGSALVGAQTGIEDACHRCDNPPCVNPAHLYVGTRRQNAADAVERGRLRQSRTTHCPSGHPYEGDNLSIKASGARRCKACARAFDKARRSGRAECKNGHPLSGDNVLLCRNGTRKCRICLATRYAKERPAR